MTERPAGGRIPDWSEADAEVIAAELVACTLGVRRRPELRVDLVAVMRRVSVQIRVDVTEVLRALNAAARAAASIRFPKPDIRPEDTQP